MQQKSNQRSSQGLAAWLNNQPPGRLRGVKVLFSICSVVIAYVMTSLALWFYQEITLRAAETGAYFNIFEWLAPLGLVLASLAAIVGSLAIGWRKNKWAEKILLFAVAVGVASLVIISVNTALFLSREGHFSSVSDAFASLLAFGRLGIGPIGISLPITLILVVVIAVLSSGEKRRK